MQNLNITKSILKKIPQISLTEWLSQMQPLRKKTHKCVMKTLFHRQSWFIPCKVGHVTMSKIHTKKASFDNKQTNETIIWILSATVFVILSRSLWTALSSNTCVCTKIRKIVNRLLFYSLFLSTFMKQSASLRPLIHRGLLPRKPPPTTLKVILAEVSNTKLTSTKKL